MRESDPRAFYGVREGENELERRKRQLAWLEEQCKGGDGVGYWQIERDRFREIVRALEQEPPKKG
jgi:hypothetical protein